MMLIEKQQKYQLYHQVIEQGKFTYSPLRKAFEKQTKTIKDQGKKQVDALESLKPSDKELP